MPSIKDIQKQLENCPLVAHEGLVEGSGLEALHQMAFGHENIVGKEDAIVQLADFYSIEQNIMDVYRSLNEAERAFVSLMVRYMGREYEPSTQRLLEEFGLSPETLPVNGKGKPVERRLEFLHLLKQARPDTKIALLFPGGWKMPDFVWVAIKDHVANIERPYPPFEPAPEDAVVCREERTGDFAALVRFVGSESVKVKPGTLDTTKAKLAKMATTIGFPEVCDGGGKFVTPQEAAKVVSRNSDFKVANTMFALAATVGLLDLANDGTVKPSQRAVQLISNPANVLAKKLYDSYWARSKIHESHFVPYLVIRGGEESYNWENCRRTVIGMLDRCPIGRWVNIEDFKRNVLVLNGNFFRPYMHEPIYFQNINIAVGGNPDWDECEGQVIEAILTFLGAMGVIDISYREHARRFSSVKAYVTREEIDERTGIAFRVAISGFRITGLGAWVLGRSSHYDPKTPNAAMQEGGGLTVQPDFSVVITGRNARSAHEPYLGSFLGRVSTDENVSIYRIDFESIVRAYRLGIMPKDISAYLSKADSHPLADNVLHSFETWQGKVGRIRIRNVTIMETDDPVLLGELTHTKAIGKYLNGNVGNAAIVADENDAKVLRAAAEKHGWLVDMDSGLEKRDKKK